MFLARVIGSVVSTKKDEAMKGRKLVMLRPMLVDEANPTQFRAGANTVVAGARSAETMIATAAKRFDISVPSGSGSGRITGPSQYIGAPIRL